MKQGTFEALHRDLWTRCQEVVEGDGTTDPQQLPSLHRRLCQSLSLARSRGYSPSLVERLHHLAQATHARLHGTRDDDGWTRLRQWLLGGFPARVRAESGSLAAALAAFAGTALVVALLCLWKPHLPEILLGPEETASLRAMYQESNLRVGRGGNGSDFAMFGFYVWNNVSILFRTFATGIFLGIPSLFALAFNGLQLGAVAVLLSQDPETRMSFWSFVATHSAPELSGLLLGGASGLRLGWSLVRPGRRGRLDSFRCTAQATLPVVAGATALVAGAAFFEAFWSAEPAIAPQVRIGVGIAGWIGLWSYLLLAGRRGGNGPA